MYNLSYICTSHRTLLSHHSIAKTATVLVILQRVHTEWDQTAAAPTTYKSEKLFTLKNILQKFFTQRNRGFHI